MSVDLLDIAVMDLQASRVLYENGLYPQAIFYFQQSVEKANKTLALIKGQVTEKELWGKIKHETIKIYEKAILHQKTKYEQMHENFNKLPELKESKILRKINIQKELKDIDFFSEYLENIKQQKNEIIYMSSWDIRRVLKAIDYFNKDVEKERRKISYLKINERDWSKSKKDIIELLNNLSKYNPKRIEEEKNNLNTIDIKQLEKALEYYYLFLFDFMSISVSLFYLTIVTSPHVSITRYPQNNLTPTNIYTKKLPIVKKLQELFEVQDKVLNDLKILNKKYEHINSEINF